MKVVRDGWDTRLVGGRGLGFLLLLLGVAWTVYDLAEGNGPQVAEGAVVCLIGLAAFARGYRNGGQT